MATKSGTQRTAELVGELVHVSPEAAKHTARVLRGAGAGLWPSPGRGVRSATFTATHLTNLLFGLGFGEPIKAVGTVRLFRGLRLAGPPIETRLIRLTNALMPPEVPRETNIRTRLADELPEMVADTLGEQFDDMVQRLADPNTSEGLRYCFETAEVLVMIEPSPRAEFSLRLDLPPPESGTAKYTWTYRPPPAQSALPIPVQQEPRTTELQRAVYGPVLGKLAAIWNETQTPTRGRVSSANETAASRAGEAAAARDQPAKADGCRVQPHPTPNGEGEKSPPPSVRRVGHPILQQGSHDDRHRPGAALGAAG